MYNYRIVTLYSVKLSFHYMQYNHTVTQYLMRRSYSADI